MVEMSDRCKGRVMDGNDYEDCGCATVRAGYCQSCFDFRLPMAQKRVDDAKTELKAALAELAPMSVLTPDLEVQQAVKLGEDWLDAHDGDLRCNAAAARVVIRGLVDARQTDRCGWCHRDNLTDRGP